MCNNNIFGVLQKLILLTVAVMSQPLSTMVGHLPPSSMMQGVMFLAAASATEIEIAVIEVLEHHKAIDVFEKHKLILEITFFISKA